MTTVTLTLNGEIVKQDRFTDFSRANKEYHRQARNAWRRQSAYCQVEYLGVFKMSWQEKAGHYYLELS